LSQFQQQGRNSLKIELIWFVLGSKDFFIARLKGQTTRQVLKNNDPKGLDVMGNL
jgi:hypothetical protein